MTQSQAESEAAGVEPFRFVPSAGTFMDAPAYSRPFRLATALFVASLGFWLALVWLVENSRGHGGSGLLAWFFAAFAMCVFFAYWIVKSRTRVDTEFIQQSWYTDKRVAVADLKEIGILRVRGLEWLVTPRVHARTLMGKFTVLHVADPTLLAEFERMGRELQAFRQRRMRA